MNRWRVQLAILLASAGVALGSDGNAGPVDATGTAAAAGLLGIVYWMARELVQTMREHLGTVDRSIDRLSAAVERALDRGAILRASSPGEQSPDTGHDRAR